MKKKIVFWIYGFKLWWVKKVTPKKYQRLRGYVDKLKQTRDNAKKVIESFERQYKGLKKTDFIYQEKIKMVKKQRSKATVTVTLMVKERAVLKILARETLDELSRIIRELQQLVNIIDNLENKGLFEEKIIIDNNSQTADLFSLENIYLIIENFYRGMQISINSFNKNAILLAHMASDNYEKEGVMADEVLRDVTEDKPFVECVETDGSFKIKLNV